jgi:hypothetical protein
VRLRLGVSSAGAPRGWGRPAPGGVEHGPDRPGPQRAVDGHAGGRPLPRRAAAAGMPLAHRPAGTARSSGRAPPWPDRPRVGMWRNPSLVHHRLRMFDGSGAVGAQWLEAATHAHAAVRQPEHDLLVLVAHGRPVPGGGTTSSSTTTTRNARRLRTAAGHPPVGGTVTATSSSAPARRGRVHRHSSAVGRRPPAGTVATGPSCGTPKRPPAATASTSGRSCSRRAGADWSAARRTCWSTSRWTWARRPHARTGRTWFRRPSR